MSLIANEDPFRSIVESIEDGLWATDRQGRAIYLNKRMATMLGYRVVDMLGRSMADFLHPEGLRFLEKVLQPNRSGISAQQDLLFRTRDGSGLWTRVTSSALIGAGGVHIGLLNSVCDIHRRKHYEAQLQADCDLFRQFGEAVNEIVWVTRWPENAVDYVSPAYEQIWGRRRADLYADPYNWVDGIHPDDRHRVHAAFEAGIEEGGYDETFRIVQPGGQVRWIRDRGFPVRDARGRVHRVAGIAEDVTESKLSQIFRAGQTRVLGQLATGCDQQEVLQSLVRMVEEQQEGMLCSVLLFDAASKRLFHGAAVSLSAEYNAAIDGVEIGPSVGSCGTAAFQRERVIVEDIAQDPLWSEYRDLAAREGLRASWSQPIFGSKSELLGTFAMYYRDARTPRQADFVLIEAAAHLAGIAIERRRDLDAIRDSERRLRQIIDLVPHMIFAKDRAGKILLGNRALAEAYGSTVEKLVGSGHGVVHTDSEEIRRMLADDLDVIDSGREKFIPEERFTDHEGNLRLLQTTKIPFRQSGSGESAMLGIAVDITERRELEKQISDQAGRVEKIFLEQALRSDQTGTWFRELYNSSADFLLTLDPSGRIVEANRSFHETIGRTPAETRDVHFSEIVAHGSRERVLLALKHLEASGRVDDVPCELLRGDGHLVDTRINGRCQSDAAGGVHQIRLVLQDTDRRESLRQRLLRTEQLVTTGRLAACVAHEVNNPLQALLMHLSLVESALPENFAERQSWNSLQEGLARIQAVVRRLLDQHSVAREHREPMNLNALVREAVQLTDSEFRARRVHSETRLAPDLPMIIGIPQHIYQVILNLLLNGAEAIGRDGTLRVTTRLDAGRVVVEVQDDGPGIPTELLGRVFSPHFTTGEDGTGLGLFVSYKLIREHEGTLEVESRPGRGTLFRIQLPPCGDSHRASPVPVM